MLWPQDGRMMKEDIRKIYDGSMFYEVAERRASKRRPVGVTRQIEKKKKV
jgi:hypothetical protein